MRAAIKTATGVDIDIYQVSSLKVEGDNIILHGDTDAKEPMLIGFNYLPGTPMSTYALTLYRPMLNSFTLS